MLLFFFFFGLFFSHIRAAFLVCHKTNREGSEGPGGLFSICCPKVTQVFLSHFGPEIALGGWGECEFILVVNESVHACLSL